ncbi:MAG: endonuclease III [Victivallales bacterium]|nr:endonuclease III [Victivallales bacterium]
MSEKKHKHPCGFTKKQIDNLYSQLAAVINPVPELHFSSAFELLIAVLLSAQCTDKAVNKVTTELWKTLHTPQDFIAFGQEALEEAIHSLGFYHSKAKHIIELCNALVEKHQGTVPDTFEELTALSGVGTKTANVVLNLWFGKPTIPVDTHVFRAAHRTGLSSARPPRPSSRNLRLSPLLNTLATHITCSSCMDDTPARHASLTATPAPLPHSATRLMYN